MGTKQEADIAQSKKNQLQAAQDKKNQALAKAKKSQPQTAQPKKRRFTFFNDVIAELKKVVWPTRQETLRLTLIVLGLCILMGVVLGAIDFGFSELVAKVFLGGK